MHCVTCKHVRHLSQRGNGSTLLPVLPKVPFCPLHAVTSWYRMHSQVGTRTPLRGRDWFLLFLCIKHRQACSTWTDTQCNRGVKISREGKGTIRKENVWELEATPPCSPPGCIGPQSGLLTWPSHFLNWFRHTHNALQSGIETVRVVVISPPAWRPPKRPSSHLYICKKTALPLLQGRG